ncbi:uncharacterized protein [Penaeus vannamei]|uniref:uncharacterized protein n=1 Tax=Penaeus vannamei TaxID=6689 RepID=UPI00387F7AD4
MTTYAKWFAAVLTTGAAVCVVMWISMPIPKVYPIYAQINLESPIYVDDAPPGVDAHNSRKIDANVERAAGMLGNLAQKIDISDDESVICSHKVLKTPDAFHKFLSNTSSECGSLAQLPPEYTPRHNIRGNWMCTTPKYLTRGDCLIYFFVDGLDTSFAEKAHERMNCKVFVFEPHEREGQLRSDAVKFYHKTIMVNQNDKGKIKMVYNQLMTLMKSLNHHDSQIDLLKIDTTQGEELIILGNIFFAPRPLYLDIKQISYAIHLRAGITTELQLHWLYFELLQCHDFRLVRTDVAEYEDELKPGSKVKVYEVLWVKKQ